MSLRCLCKSRNRKKWDTFNFLTLKQFGISVMEFTKSVGKLQSQLFATVWLVISFMIVHTTEWQTHRKFNKTSSATAFRFIIHCLVLKSTRKSIEDEINYKISKLFISFFNKFTNKKTGLKLRNRQYSLPAVNNSTSIDKHFLVL